MPREGRSGFIRETLNVVVKIPSGTSAGEILTDYKLGFKAWLEKAVFNTTVAGTGVGANRTLRVVKGTSTVVATGTLTLAGTSDIGEQTALTVTDDDTTNLFEDTDNLTVDLPAAGAVEFTAGEGQLILTFRTRPQQKH